MTLHTHAMDRAQSLPDEIILPIIQYSVPKLNLNYENAHKPGRWYHTGKGTFPDDSADKDQQNTSNATNNLKEICTIIQKSRLLSKHWDNVIVQNIATWLGINRGNINAFLIRATQANIPYFIRLAVAHKADLNFVHKPDGYTPLLCATKNNQYNTCVFLLKMGASVNIKREMPYATYEYDHNAWPIHIAIKNNNLELVKLFIRHHTDLYFSFFPTTNLLSLVAQQNNPYILSALLEDNHWAEGDEIEHALETVKRLQLKTDKEKLEQRACINILQETQQQSLINQKNMLLSFLQYSNHT